MKHLLHTLAISALLVLQSSGQEKLKVYTNEKLNFRMTYPENWTLQDLKEGASVLRLTAPKENAGDTFQETVTISRQPLGAAGSLAAWVQAQTGVLRELYPDFAITESEALKISGQDSWSLGYTATVNGTKVTGVRLSTMVDGMVVTGSLLAQKGKLSVYLPILKSALASVKKQ